MATSISWTNETWNPVTGCSKVSPGCAHCYAERLSLKFGWSKAPWTPENAEQNVVLHPERLNKPLTWKTPRMVFVNSMSDLFHELVPVEFIERVFTVMGATPDHTYQVLTKRPERMAEVVNAYTDRHLGGKPLPNVWLGTSVENQHWADVRIPALLEAPAVVRFLSCEPLLGPLDLSWYLCDDFARDDSRWENKINWVIVGGESGPGFRTMNHDWARDIRNLCANWEVAFFFKQSSAFRSETGTTLDGQEYHEFPQVTVNA